MEHQQASTRKDVNVQRPRSLCDSKLLAVSPHSVHHHAKPNGSTGLPPPHPNLSTSGHPIVHRPNKPSDTSVQYRGSWPNHSAVNSGFASPWNNGHDPDLSTYPTPLAMAEKAPSMAGLLNTTVPQRLVARPVRGQHKPTRHSLRHSRMISLIQQGKVPRRYLPPVIHHYRLGITLVMIQVVLGTALLGLGLYLLLWSPHLSIHDVPHWSGASMLVSGLFGLFLMCCCRKQYPGMRGGCCTFALKVQYIACNVLLAMLSAAACLCACTFASFHVSQLFDMNCSENDASVLSNVDPALNSTCTCRTSSPDSIVYDYSPLSCFQVEHILSMYLLASAVAHGVAVFVCVCYILLLWSNRYAYTYAGLKIAEQKSAAMSSLY